MCVCEYEFMSVCNYSCLYRDFCQCVHACWDVREGWGGGGVWCVCMGMGIYTCMILHRGLYCLCIYMYVCVCVKYKCGQQVRSGQSV